MSHLALILASAFAALPPTTPPDRELDKFHGTWKMVRDHSLKRDMTGVKDKWIITGDYLTVDSLREEQGTFKFDSDVNPHRFTRTIDGSRENLPLRGTYRLAGEILTFYNALTRQFPEPVDLPADPLPGYGLRKWKRVGKASGEGLDGEWKLIEWIATGNRRMYVNDQSMRIRDGKWSNISHFKHEYTIKTDGKNGFLDLIRRDTNGPSPRNSIELRVYRFDAERLTVWQGLGGRPTDVSDAPDSDNRFQVFERLNP